MKYIRTKDGIIFPTKAEEKDIDKSIYLKVADTIEELCDEFIGTRENKKPIVQSSYTKLKPSLYILKNDLDIKDIYGAIWTDKGLIYVAKMNDKGELELL